MNFSLSLQRALLRAQPLPADFPKITDDSNCVLPIKIATPNSETPKTTPISSNNIGYWIAGVLVVVAGIGYFIYDKYYRQKEKPSTQ